MRPELLSNAVWVGDLHAVELLIAEGTDVNLSSGDRQPPLYLAIEQQWVEIVRRLLTAGADVNRDLGEGWTPLVHAIDVESDTAYQAGRAFSEISMELTELLLTSGAIPTRRAFEVAEDYRNIKALELLRRKSPEGGRNDAQRPELERRIAEDDANPDDVVAWARVKEQIMSRLNPNGE